jgi:hypothetical protein
MSPMTAWMMIAPSAASGRSSNNPVRKSIVRINKPPVMRLAHLVLGSVLRLTLALPMTSLAHPVSRPVLGLTGAHPATKLAHLVSGLVLELTGPQVAEAQGLGGVSYR